MELQLIQNKIYELRGQKIMLDFDLAVLYETETRILKQAVRRNMDRFPEDFMFQLKKKEWNELITICDKLPKNIKFNPSTPFAFTEQGVAMLSSVLNSKKAIHVNIIIIRAFVLFRQHLYDYKNLQIQMVKIEKEMNIKFKDIHQALNYLLKKDNPENRQKQRKKIGY